MLKDNQNIKDVSSNKDLSLASAPSYYSKLNKLITALYMVTDIMDKNEPLRNKLRDLGAGIISDITSSSVQANQKIIEILSFLDIASSVGMISGMNSSILKKEFLELQKSIQGYSKQSNPMWLEEFMATTTKNLTDQDQGKQKEFISTHQGHSTRIGVQKGSTLMKALNNFGVSARPIGESDKIDIVSDTSQNKNALNFDILKQQRREEILKIIKEKKEVYPEAGGATITDIRNKAKELPKENVLFACGDKTLQRELISMVHDNVLYKSGEKRWSKYFLPS